MIKTYCLIILDINLRCKEDFILVQYFFIVHIFAHYIFILSDHQIFNMIYE